tara:strand:+ start:351 stop:596 length:246 start_codon:yes stop_codon:yes gene_type:complete
MSNSNEIPKSNNDLNEDQEENIQEIINDRQTSATSGDIPDFGWSSYAERMNGRFAMIGLTAVLIIEICTSKTFINWAGFIN